MRSVTMKTGTIKSQSVKKETTKTTTAATITQAVFWAQSLIRRLDTTEEIIMVVDTKALTILTVAVIERFSIRTEEIISI